MILKILLVASFGLITLSSAYGLERIRWKVQVIANSGYWVDLWKDYVENVKNISDGKIKFRIYDPNSIVPNYQVWEAIADDQLDAALISPIYKSTKIPALHFFVGVPFGPGFIEHTVWMRFGGGQKLKDRIYGNMGLYSFDCFMSPPESGGWFKKKVESINQLKGEKIRFLGFGGKVMEKIGMEIALLGWKDIVPALEKDKISAVELGAPHNDVGLGFHKITKYNYYPGWFQQTFPIELIVNKNTWSKLSKTAQGIIKTS